MASVRFNDLRTRLDIKLRDQDNFTFEPFEKDEILRAAIEDDPECYVISTDSSEVIVAGVSTYDVPFDRLIRVGLDYYNDGYPTPLLASDWVQDGEQLILSRNYMNLPAGGTLYMTGSSQLTSKDIIPPSFVAYIMANALVSAVDMIFESKINRFVRNETTVSEMQQLRNNQLQNVARYKKNLRRNSGVVF